MRRELIAWGLVAVLLFAVTYQYIGANKAEGRAEQAEATAKAVDQKLQEYTLQAAEREKQAEARFQASEQQVSSLRAILARGSQVPPKVPLGRNTEPVGASAALSKGSEFTPAAQAGCVPFIYQDKPLVISNFPV